MRWFRLGRSLCITCLRFIQGLAMAMTPTEKTPKRRTSICHGIGTKKLISPTMAAATPSQTRKTPGRSSSAMNRAVARIHQVHMPPSAMMMFILRLSHGHRGDAALRR
jgi:hypothetical protein